jgi:DNA repair exonuclease SbcCD ATPase subunit
MKSSSAVSSGVKKNDSELSVTLEHYGTHRRERTVVFSGPGVVLLQAPSGKGKSSVLDGIHYALYGKPKRVNWFERSCRVTFRFGDWTIVRTGTKSDKTDKFTDDKKEGKASSSVKIPNCNSLLLYQAANPSTPYKSAEAQALIDQRFGTNFAITSYITQKDIASFFSLGPSDRIGFLERVAFGDEDIAGHKKKLKSKIAERRDLLAEKVAELKFTAEESLKHPEPTTVACPLEKQYTEIRAKNERSRLAKAQKAIKETMQNVMKLSTAQSAAETNKSKLAHLTKEIDELLTSLGSIESQIKTVPAVDTKTIDMRINTIRVNQELVKTRLLHSTEETQYKAECIIEKDRLQCDLDERLKTPIVVDISKDLLSKASTKQSITKLQSTIKSLESELEDLEPLEKHTEEIAKLNDTERAQIQLISQLQEAETVRHCPKCQASIRLINGTLTLYNGVMPDASDQKAAKKELDSIRKSKADWEDSMRELKRVSGTLEKARSDLKRLPSIDLLQDYDDLYAKHVSAITQQKINQDRIKDLRYKLDHHVYDARTQARGRKVEEFTLKLKQLEASLSVETISSLTNKENIDDLQKQLENAKMNNQRRSMLLERKAEISSKLKRFEADAKTIPIDATDYAQSISIANSSLADLKLEEKSRREIVAKLELYEAYIEKRDVWQSWKKRSIHATEDELSARKSLGVAERFMKKIQENEGIAVQNIIDNINHHLAFFADRFFTDPISVEITPFKEGKDGDKLSVNIKLFFKGATCSVKELSGGETARLELAICLAINSLGNGSMLLLDECFSSLDSVTTEDIVELLKTHAKETGKLIISVCHQASEGSFDSVINLGPLRAP